MLEPITVSQIVGSETSSLLQGFWKLTTQNSFHTWFTPPQTIDSNHVCTKPTHSPFSSLSRPLCVPQDHLQQQPPRGEPARTTADSQGPSSERKVFACFIDVSGEEMLTKTRHSVNPELPQCATAAQSSSGVDATDTRQQSTLWRNSQVRFLFRGAEDAVYL